MVELVLLNDRVRIVHGRMSLPRQRHIFSPRPIHRGVDCHTCAMIARQLLQSRLQDLVNPVQIDQSVLRNGRLHPYDLTVLKVEPHILVAQVVDAMYQHASNRNQQEAKGRLQHNDEVL